MHRFTLRTNLFVWVGVSGVSDREDSLQAPPAEVPSGWGCTLGSLSAHAQSDFLSVLWPLRGLGVWQGQGLNDFPLAKAYLCQFAHWWQPQPGTNRSNSCWCGFFFFLISNYNSTCHPKHSFEWVGGGVKELGSFKTVIFILTLSWDQGRKSFAPNMLWRGSTNQKRELVQSVCA